MHKSCNKIGHRIECYDCGYPHSEARYSDNIKEPLPCDSTDEKLEEYIRSLADNEVLQV